MDEQTQKDAAFVDEIKRACASEFRTMRQQVLDLHWKRLHQSELQKRLAKALGVPVRVSINPTSHNSFNTRIMAHGFTTQDVRKTFKQGERVVF